jgi:hypothetical protein
MQPIEAVSGEAREIIIAGNPLTPMFNSDCGMLCVRHSFTHRNSLQEACDKSRILPL